MKLHNDKPANFFFKKPRFFQPSSKLETTFLTFHRCVSYGRDVHAQNV